MVTVKVRLHVMVLEEIVIASKIVMVNVSVRENKIVSVTENVRENVIVTENVTEYEVDGSCDGERLSCGNLYFHIIALNVTASIIIHVLILIITHMILNHHHFHQTSTQDHQDLHWKLSGTPAGL